MRRLIVRILAVIGGAVVMMVIASLIGVSMLYRATGGEDIPEKTIVEINFEQAFVEHQEDNSVTGGCSPVSTSRAVP